MNSVLATVSPIQVQWRFETASDYPVGFAFFAKRNIKHDLVLNNVIMRTLLGSKHRLRIVDKQECSSDDVIYTFSAESTAL